MSNKGNAFGSYRKKEKEKQKQKIKKYIYIRRKVERNI